jgi:hypothetical protein
VRAFGTAVVYTESDRYTADDASGGCRRRLMEATRLLQNGKLRGQNLPVNSMAIYDVLGDAIPAMRDTVREA